MFDFGIAIILAAIAVALVAWFFRHKASSSERRMQQMMRHAGLDPETVSDSDFGTIIEEVRKRCRRCQTEGRCERWLAGKEVGDNSFCPNKEVFEEIRRRMTGAGKEPGVSY